MCFSWISGGSTSHFRRTRGQACSSWCRRHKRRLDGLSRCSCQQIGVDEAVQVAVENALGVSDFEIGPMILDELVGMEHVAANRVAAEAHADDTSFLRELLLPFLLRELGQAGSEDPQGGLLVRRLRALVLTLDDDPGGQMRDP